MNEIDVAKGIGYAVAAIVALAGAFWWGYEVRERLAVKLEYFRVSNRRWVEYDEQLKQQRGKLLPLRGELHDIHDRQSEK